MYNLCHDQKVQIMLVDIDNKYKLVTKNISHYCMIRLRLKNAMKKKAK